MFFCILGFPVYSLLQLFAFVGFINDNSLRWSKGTNTLFFIGHCKIQLRLFSLKKNDLI